MSAWIVSKEHVDYIVSAQKYEKYGPFSVWHDGERHRHTETEWGQILWTENVRSVRYRYPDDGPTGLPGSVDFDPGIAVKSYRFARRDDVTRIGAYKAIHSLEYQSCEHPEWNSSLAKAYCLALRDTCITSMAAYDTADTWSI